MEALEFDKPYHFVFKRPPKFHDDFRNIFLHRVPNITDDDPDLYYRDDKVVVIYDQFPKAMYHLLILPKDTTVIDMSHLTKEHIPLIQHMQFVGEQIIKQYVIFISFLTRISLKSVIKEKIEFKVGFHALPSLKLLHLHVISQDFVSKSLKKIEHWNSFTTNFFISPEFVLQELNEKGKVEIDQEEFAKIKESKIMKCTRTGQTFNNMGALKSTLQKLFNNDQKA
jgi:aprataxin